MMRFSVIVACGINTAVALRAQNLRSFDSVEVAKTIMRQESVDEKRDELQKMKDQMINIEKLKPKNRNIEGFPEYTALFQKLDQILDVEAAANDPTYSKEKVQKEWEAKVAEWDGLPAPKTISADTFLQGFAKSDGEDNDEACCTCCQHVSSDDSFEESIGGVTIDGGGWEKKWGWGDADRDALVAKIEAGTYDVNGPHPIEAKKNPCRRIRNLFMYGTCN